MNYNIKISSPDENIAKLVRELIDSDLPPDSQSVYCGIRNRVVKVHRGGHDINVKSFKIPDPINKYVYGRLRKSKARRSFEHAQILLEMGFRTPHPLAYIEEFDGPRFNRSFYISEQLQDFEEMRQLPEDNQLWTTLAEDLAVLMTKLHKMGVWMKDFSMGNVLRRLTPDGHYDFFLVDINRMDFNVEDKQKLWLNFRNITDNNDFLDYLSCCYADLNGLNKAEFIHKAQRIRLEFLERSKDKNRFKRFFKLKKN